LANSTGGEHDIGFIAEEIGEVAPEVVTYEENGIDATGVDYDRMVPLAYALAFAFAFCFCFLESVTLPLLCILIACTNPEMPSESSSSISMDY